MVALDRQRFGNSGAQLGCPLDQHWRLVAALAGSGSDLPSENWTVKVNVGSVPTDLTVGQPVVLGFRPEDAWIF
jgi:hypothetical protein